MAALLLCIISAALSAWESRSLGRHLSRPTLSRLPHTASLATWSKVARRQTDSNFPLVDLLVVIAIYGNVRTAMTASLVQIHERLRQSIRGVLDPIIYNPIKKLLKTDGKKSAQVREAGVSRRLWCCMSRD